MDAEQLVRRIIGQNAAARSRSAAAHSMVFNAMTNGGELDVEEIFQKNEGERDESPEVAGEAEPLDGDTGGTAAGT